MINTIRAAIQAKAAIFLRFAKLGAGLVSVIEASPQLPRKQLVCRPYNLSRCRAFIGFSVNLSLGGLPNTANSSDSQAIL
jgi:hypothetical protein